MPNPIVFQFAFWLYTIIAACSWQPIIRYPQPVNEYRVNCMVRTRAPGADPMLWLLSGVLQGPVLIGGEKDYDITQETY